MEIPGKYVNKVHAPLAAALGDTSGIRVAFVDRYSTEEHGGLESQVARHMALYPEDKNVAAYLQRIDDGAFEEVPTAGRGCLDDQLTPVWVSAVDVHHLARDSKPQVAMMRIGDALFVRVSMSAMRRDIRREDGSEDNVYTLLILSLLSACQDLEAIRWASDVTRAARDSVNWTLLLRAHRERQVHMGFAGQLYDPTDQGARVTLSLLGALGSEDDPTRRLRMLGGQIHKIADGQFGLGPQFLPYGWNLPTTERGTVRSGAKPVGDPKTCLPLQALYQGVASGTPPRDIVMQLARFEAEGLMARRAGNNEGFSFQTALEHRSPTACTKLIAKMIRTPKWNGIPSPDRPSEEQISDYLAGGDPTDIFDVSQRLALAIVELLRTGVWLRAQQSTIRQSRLSIGGYEAHYFDSDGPGFFLIPAKWSWPIDDQTGQTIERFGIPDETLRQAGARLLRSLRPGNSGRKGGRAHIRAERRAFQEFGEWENDGNVYCAWAAPGASKGLVNTVIYSQPIEDRQPWSYLKNGPARSAATFRQSHLVMAIVRNLTEDLPDYLDAASVPAKVALVVSQSDERLDRATGLEARARRALADADAEENDARRLRRLAALVLEQSGKAEALIHLKEADECTASAVKMRERASEFQSEARKLRADALTESHHGEDEVEADLSIVAYLAAALSRSVAQKRVPASIGELCDRMFHDWRLVPEMGSDGKPQVKYEVLLTPPVLDGVQEISIKLTGTVADVGWRSRQKTQ